jgi:exodeoxyribonuclease VII large subunit
MCDNIISDPMRLIRSKEQNLDHITFRLTDLMPNLLERKSMKLGNIVSQISLPRSKFAMYQMKLDSAFSKLGNSVITHVDKGVTNLDLQSQLLDTLSYNNVLKRGFAIIKSEDKVINSVFNISPKENITIQMHDGNVGALVREISEK